MANPWMTHVKATMKANPKLKFKDVLKKAKKTYKKQPKASASKKAKKVKKVKKTKKTMKVKKGRKGRKGSRKMRGGGNDGEMGTTTQEMPSEMSPEMSQQESM